MTRSEHDLLGELAVPASGYGGIHTARARANFAVGSQRVPVALVHAFGEVKKACAAANLELGYLGQAEGEAVMAACDELAAGRLDAEFDLDALQGGAGTSTNMCANELIANRALELLGRAKGDYATIHPLHQVNLHQSTNDVYPTALRVAAVRGVRDLSVAVASLQNELQKQEKAFGDLVTIGRTEWIEAVPVVLGRQFSAFAEAIARDRWRTFKCEERLRVVNLGGTMVGNGLGAPRSYIFLATEKLRQFTGLGFSRAENLMDATANLDPLVEVSGIVRTLAVDLMKICRDLRFLHASGEITLPAVQAGSSAMPGKVNPVILECVIQVAIKSKANDAIVAECAGLGTLQINEFMPLVALALLESLELLGNACRTLAPHVAGIVANRQRCQTLMADTPALMAAFVPQLGYETATQWCQEFAAGRVDGGSFLEFLRQRLGNEQVEQTLGPDNLNALGFR